MNDDELTQHLNQLTNDRTVAPPYLAERILARLPDAAPLDNVIQWFSATLWRGAVATAVPVMVGFTIGMTGLDTQPVDDSLWYHTQSLVYADSLEDYDYDEI